MWRVNKVSVCRMWRLTRGRGCHWLSSSHSLIITSLHHCTICGARVKTSDDHMALAVRYRDWSLLPLAGGLGRIPHSVRHTNAASLHDTESGE